MTELKTNINSSGSLFWARSVSRSESPQPTIEDGAAETAEASGNGAAEKDDAAAGNAEVVDLSPAKLSEIVQEEQDSASA